MKGVVAVLLEYIQKTGDTNLPGAPRRRLSSGASPIEIPSIETPHLVATTERPESDKKFKNSYHLLRAIFSSGNFSLFCNLQWQKPLRN